MSYSVADFLHLLETHLPEVQDQQEAVAVVARALHPLLQQPDLFPPEFLEALKTGQNDGQLYHSPGLDFVVQVFGWPDGVTTPVHDHETWGVMGIYQGVLKIEEFELSPEALPGHYQLNPAAEYLAGPGAISYLLSPQDEIHRISNPGPEYALSLHIYGNPIRNYHQFDLESGRIQRV